MAFLNVTSKNVKFTVVETDSVELKEDDCFIEVVVNKNFLDCFLMNLVMSKDSEFEGDITLTRRERQVLNYISCGINNAQIAKKMNVSVHTAKVHIHNIFNKLSVQDRTEAVVKAIKYKLIDI